MATFIVAVIIAAAFVSVLVHEVKKRKRGEGSCSCGGSCGACGAGCHENRHTDEHEE